MVRPYASVLVTVDTQGHVTNARVHLTTGVPSFDTAALAAVRQWTFAPALQDCKAVAQEVEYAVGFASGYTFADPFNHDAVVVHPVAPKWPSGDYNHIGRELVAVKVSVDQHGWLTGVTFVQPSSDLAMNQLAMQAALSSTYAPAVHNGIPEPGNYVFKVTFDPTR